MDNDNTEKSAYRSIIYVVIVINRHKPDCVELFLGSEFREKKTGLIETSEIWEILKAQSFEILYASVDVSVSIWRVKSIDDKCTA